MGDGVFGQIDRSGYRSTLGTYPTGVVVVTAAGQHGPVGMTIGSFVSVSLSPPLVGFLPGKTSWTWERMQESGAFCVNVLADDQLSVCHAFASPEGTRFGGVPWRAAATGSPVIDGVISWIDCTIESVQMAGDHWWVVGAVEAMSVERENVGALQFFRGTYGAFAQFPAPA